jgi:ubiquinone/menaquinone biosynthesis C-methylase UbiE
MARDWGGGAKAVGAYRRLIEDRLFPGSHVLHAGCGWDKHEILRAHADSCRVVGVDLDRRVSLMYHSPFALASVSALPFADGVFDAVVCEYVLEHLLDPHATLREFARVLTPGGQLCLLTPNLYSYKSVVAAITPHWFHEAMGRLRYGPGHEQDMYPTVYRCNTRRAALKAAKASGFSNVSVTAVTNGPTWFVPFPVLFQLGHLFHRAIDRYAALGHLRCALLVSGTQPSTVARKDPHDTDAY